MRSPFIIPVTNKSASGKPGSGQHPKYFGEKTNFVAHKEKMVGEARNILASLEASFPLNKSITDNVYFEFEFHEKVLSKSSQPKKLLVDNRIDIYGQKSERVFLASCKPENLRGFSNNIENMVLEANNKSGYSADSGYLSAITSISTLSKEEILIDPEFIVPGEVFKWVIYLHDALSENEARKVYDEEIKQYSENSEFIVSGAGAKLIYGSFEGNFLDQISEPHPKNPIQKIEKVLEFTATEIEQIPIDMEGIETGSVQGNSKIAILDTGIMVGEKYNSLVIGHENTTGDSPTRLHGTFVASRAIFGNDIMEQLQSGILKPKCKVLDVQIIGDTGSADNIKIVEAIKYIISQPQYSDIKVFNLSIGEKKPDIAPLPGKKQTVHTFTRDLDDLSYEHGVLFIIASGNHSSYLSETYPGCLFKDECRINPPTDMINGFSIGSIADISGNGGLSLLNEPSPFSRIGGDISRKKPDLVHFGGNVDHLGGCSDIGSKGILLNNSEIAEKSGTSYAAPLVSQIAANLYSYLINCDIHTSTIDLVKGLIISSARYELPTGSTITTADLDRIVGFGLPDLDRALNSASSSCTFIYCDQLKKYQDKDIPNENIHKIRFTIPDELNAQGNKKIKIKGTLVYTSPVSSSGDFSYALANIEMNMHNITNTHKLKSSGLTKGIRDYRMPWSPIKHFEIDFDSFQPGDWEIRLTLNTRGPLENKEQYSQNYALVIEMEDISDTDERLDLHELVRNRYPQYTLVQERVRNIS